GSLSAGLRLKDTRPLCVAMTLPYVSKRNIGASLPPVGLGSASRKKPRRFMARVLRDRRTETEPRALARWFIKKAEPRTSIPLATLFSRIRLPPAGGDQPTKLPRVELTDRQLRTSTRCADSKPRQMPILFAANSKRQFATRVAGPLHRIMVSVLLTFDRSRS